MTAAILCLASLTSCSTAPVKVEYIEQQLPPKPEWPALYPVNAWQRIGGQYCLNADHAKRLLKDEALLYQYGNDVELIWEKK